jgi:hypothetical protein
VVAPAPAPCCFCKQANVFLHHVVCTNKQTSTVYFHSSSLPSTAPDLQDCPATDAASWHVFSFWKGWSHQTSPSLWIPKHLKLQISNTIALGYPSQLSWKLMTSGTDEDPSACDVCQIHNHNHLHFGSGKLCTQF